MTHATLTRLAQHRDTLLGMVADLPEEALDWRAEEGWSIRQILTHLVNAEEDHRAIIEAVVDGNTDRIPIEFDIDTHNNGRVAGRGHLDKAGLLAGLAAQRELTQDLFERLSEAQLDLLAPHPALGEMSLGNIFRVIAMHEKMHAREIELIRARHKAHPG